MNIGVQLGTASNGLTDIDLDCTEAIRIAPYVLPATRAIFGRVSKRASHRLYYTDLANRIDNAVLAFNDPNKGVEDGRLLELRIGGGGRGAQTVFPGSVHKEGEPITWEETGDPASVDGDDLRRRVRALAAYCLLARYWPPQHSGHHGRRSKTSDPNRILVNKLGSRQLKRPTPPRGATGPFLRRDLRAWPNARPSEASDLE